MIVLAVDFAAEWKEKEAKDARKGGEIKEKGFQVLER